MFDQAKLGCHTGFFLIWVKRKRMGAHQHLLMSDSLNVIATQTPPRYIKGSVVGDLVSLNNRAARARGFDLGQHSAMTVGEQSARDAPVYVKN
jgi:hypothetical protein